MGSSSAWIGIGHGASSVQSCVLACEELRSWRVSDGINVGLLGLRRKVGLGLHLADLLGPQMQG